MFLWIHNLSGESNWNKISKRYRFNKPGGGIGNNSNPRYNLATMKGEEFPLDHPNDE
jgi:hypothetical protein